MALELAIRVRLELAKVVEEIVRAEMAEWSALCVGAAEEALSEVLGHLAALDLRR